MLGPVHPQARLSLGELRRQSRSARDAQMELAKRLSWRIYSHLGMPFLKGALWIGLTPNQLTWLSILVGLAAAALLAGGGYATGIVAAVLLQAMVAMDYADGALARLTGQTSLNGLYLASIAFDIVGPLLFFAIAWGVHRRGGSEWYLLAGFGGAMAYLFNRHFYNAKIVMAVIGDKTGLARALTNSAGEPPAGGGAGAGGRPRSWRAALLAVLDFPWPMRIFVNVLTVAALADRMAWLSIFYGIAYPVAVILVLRKEARSGLDWVYRWAGEVKP